MLHAVTSAQRRAALEEFDRALGSYPGAAEYLDQQRAIERRNDALAYESLAPSAPAPASAEAS